MSNFISFVDKNGIKGDIKQNFKSYLSYHGTTLHSYRTGYSSGKVINDCYKYFKTHFKVKEL